MYKSISELDVSRCSKSMGKLQNNPRMTRKFYSSYFQRIIKRNTKLKKKKNGRWKSHFEIRKGGSKMMLHNRHNRKKKKIIVDGIAVHKLKSMVHSTKYL